MGLCFVDARCEIILRFLSLSKIIMEECYIKLSNNVIVIKKITACVENKKKVKFFENKKGLDSFIDSYFQL